MAPRPTCWEAEATDTNCPLTSDMHCDTHFVHANTKENNKQKSHTILNEKNSNKLF